MYKKLIGCIAAFLILAAACPAYALDFPTRPVKLMIPSGAGGSADLFARLVAQKLSEVWGKAVVVENRPGSGGVLGMTAASKAPPDGYTLLIASSAELATLQAVYKEVPYDVIRDFSPIMRVTSTPYVLVGNVDSPIRNIADLVLLAKKSPGKINIASAGTGGTSHLLILQLMSATKIEVLHVPYKSSPAALTSVVSGETQLMFTGLSSGTPLISSGRVRAVAVTGQQRSLLLPQTPTFSEQGVQGFDSGSWTGILAPAGTPPEILDAVRSSLVEVLRMPEVREYYAREGLTPLDGSPEEFSQVLKQDIEKWNGLIRASGFKSE